MHDFVVWLLISIGAGILLFPAAYFYERWESKREGTILPKKKSLLIAAVMGAWPIAACLATWAGLWLGL